jgi:hypothetical protein
MSDRTYTRFSIPLSVLANVAMTEAIRSAFEFSISDFQSTLLSDPVPDEAAGHDSFAVRLIDGRPFLVYEEEDCNYGGASIEDELCASHVPFIQVNGVGDEYGPTSTVYDGETSEVIRLDHDLEPISGIGLIAGRVTVDPGEIADFERYLRLRQVVLLYPALPA